MSKKAVTYLVVVFIAFAFALHYPFLAVANQPQLIYGIPVFFIYLIIVWLLLILAGYIVVRRNRARDNHGD